MYQVEIVKTIIDPDCNLNKWLKRPKRHWAAYDQNSRGQESSDRPATDAAKGGSGGINIQWPRRNIEAHFFPTGSSCFNYTAEAATIVHAARFIKT